MVTPAKDDPAFEALLGYIRSNRGFDCTGYKRPSLLRRFGKRMGELKIRDYAEYRDYLEAQPEEFVALFDTILINVTGFFRDQPAWDYIRSEVVPRVVDARGPAEAIRVWSTGCASGEEAYSLAILFSEALGEKRFQDRVKIYATDIDESASTEGRHATYPAKALEGLSAELRDRYFETADQRYVFRPELRRAVIFGRHDLLQDPPISRVDLLASRNTLMYFNPEAQARILTNFAFALRDTGFLFLGKSEVLMTRTNLFVPVDLRRRVFAKVPRLEVLRPALPVEATAEDSLAELAADRLMREAGFEAAPAAQLVVDRTGRFVLANHQAPDALRPLDARRGPTPRRPRRLVPAGRPPLSHRAGLHRAARGCASRRGMAASLRRVAVRRRPRDPARRGDG
jgi:two-component system CheB/CheR fusion protein